MTIAPSNRYGRMISVEVLLFAVAIAVCTRSAPASCADSAAAMSGAVSILLFDDPFPGGEEHRG